jgi:peptide-methionine (S)-S-oxide reductase
MRSLIERSKANRRQITRSIGLAAALVALAAVSWPAAPDAAENVQVVPPPANDAPLSPSPDSATAVFAGGCFWGVQGVFQHVDGVTSAVSGYAGGSAADAIYEIVGSGRTGHAESVEITYDPSKISYGRLLQIFFSVAHDPTQVDRQGPDIGTQYRSAIFTTDESQKKIALDYIAQLDQAEVFQAPIATEVSALPKFFPAEGYHQDYATLHPDSPYIFYNDLPKIAALQRLFPQVWRDQPALVGAGKSG